MPRTGRAAAWLVVAATLAASLAQAQTFPDAGSQLKQLERERQKPLPPQATPQFEPPAPLKSIGGATVTVTAFRFAGNKLLSDAKLRHVVKPYQHRPLDFAQLQNVAIAVAEAYRKSGWVVRAYLPQQDVTNGTVTIQIVEAVFGAVRVQSHSKHISRATVERTIDLAQSPGKPANADALDRALLLINDLPGVSATGSLAEGAREGETDLLVDIQNRPLVSGYVSADDYGERTTGSARISEQLSLNSPFGRGDRADASLLHTKGSDFESLGYSIPAGYRGLRVGLSASHLSYRIVTADFAALDAHGSSTTGDFNATYPLIRSRLANLYASLDLSDKSFDNDSNGATVSHYAVDSASAALYGNEYDSFAGGGTSTASLSFEQGLVDLARSPNEADDARTAATAGSFHKVSFAASRLQALSQRLALFASASGQVTDKNLDSSEKFYLGGPTGVRAYPVNEVGGSEGALLNVEVRAQLPVGFNLTGFYDLGAVHVNRNNDFLGAAPVNTQKLAGAGASVAWVAPFGLSIRATVARRIGSNPNLTSTGTDQDGSLIRNRVWVQATMPF